MGGIQTDLDGRTNVPGLYAVGECACTGVHGANRLASNSLLESLVFAYRCAQLFLDKDPNPNTDPNTNPGAPGLASETWVPTAAPAQTAITRRTLQTLMWNNAGIERTAVQLHAALTQLETSTAPGQTVESRETANLLTLAIALVSSALAREESRGAHFRQDFPNANPADQYQSTYPSAGVPHDVPGEAPGIVGGILEAVAC